MLQLNFEWFNDFIDNGRKENKLGTFNMKVCSLCKIEKEANRENFSKETRNKDKLSSHCRECHNKYIMKNSYFKREKGLCDGCSEKALPNRSRCAYHTVYNVLKNQQKVGRFTQLKTGKEKKAFVLALLQKLEDQNYKCAITGVEIALGDNASLDHIQEICNGGTCELDNLQWVSASANAKKPRKYKGI